MELTTCHLAVPGTGGSPQHGERNEHQSVKEAQPHRCLGRCPSNMLTGPVPAWVQAVVLVCLPCGPGPPSCWLQPTPPSPIGDPLETCQDSLSPETASAWHPPLCQATPARPARADTWPVCRAASPWNCAPGPGGGPWGTWTLHIREGSCYGPMLVSWAHFCLHAPGAPPLAPEWVESGWCLSPGSEDVSPSVQGTSGVLETQAVCTARRSYSEFVPAWGASVDLSDLKIPPFPPLCPHMTLCCPHQQGLCVMCKPRDAG